MKTYLSELYGDITEPETFEELIELLTFKHCEEHIVHMWRGQSNIKWRIDHSAYRRLQIERHTIRELELVRYEENLLKHATHKGYRIQDGRILSDFELLAKLQHHGAATRLLDFSRNALIALWFCVIENLKETGLLIGLHAHYLLGYESEDEGETYSNIIKLLETYKHPVTWEPPVVTPRIAAQHSQFIYSSLSNDKRGSIKLNDKDSCANLFIAISPKLKILVEDILEKSFDLRYSTLFPDIDGFANANSHKIPSTKMWRW